MHAQSLSCLQYSYINPNNEKIIPLLGILFNNEQINFLRRKNEQLQLLLFCDALN